jgi:hypothetical protein
LATNSSRSKTTCVVPSRPTMLEMIQQPAIR